MSNVFDFLSKIWRSIKKYVLALITGALYLLFAADIAVLINPHIGWPGILLLFVIVGVVFTILYWVNKLGADVLFHIKYDYDEVVDEGYPMFENEKFFKPFSSFWRAFTSWSIRAIRGIIYIGLFVLMMIWIVVLNIILFFENFFDFWKKNKKYFLATISSLGWLFLANWVFSFLMPGAAVHNFVWFNIISVVSAAVLYLASKAGYIIFFEGTTGEFADNDFFENFSGLAAMLFLWPAIIILGILSIFGTIGIGIVILFISLLEIWADIRLKRLAKKQVKGNKDIAPDSYPDGYHENS